MPTLPGSQVVIDDCKDDGLYHGRHRPPGDPTGDWHPVTEEAPIDNQQYGRINGVWLPVAAGGKSVTEIVPAVATVGLSAALPAILYGTGFVTGDVVLWDGIAQPTVVVSPNELSFSIDTNLGVSPSSVTITVAGATGAAGFVFLPPATGVDYGTGLTLDTTQDPDIVHLQPAGDSPATLGGVYVVDRVRNVEEGLELGADGRLRAPLATDALAGTLLEPPPDDKGYVRRRTAAGVSNWVPPADTVGPDFGTGLTEQPGADPGDPPIVHLQPAGDSPATLGGVYVIDRERNVEQGLQLDGDGRLQAPLATPRLAGTIVEPEDDGKGYVRTTLNGVSMWVPPADTVGPEFGTGLWVDKTQDPDLVHLQPAGPLPQHLGGVYVPPRDDTLKSGLTIDMGDAALGDPATGEILAPPATDLLLGTLTEPTPDGMAYSRQWDNVTDPANPKWVWVPALTAGLQITSIIPDKAIYGPTEPPLLVHAYGSEFTATCVIRVDGVDAIPTNYVSPTELTFTMNPAVPISEQFHIITVHETAPTPVDGLGAEQFDFFKATTEVDYGTGLSLDTAPTPPMVNLQPAGWDQKFLGGVYTTGPRTATEGLDLAAAGTGQLSVPLATDLLAGSIVEPPPDDKGYVRRRTIAGVSEWVPPALQDTEYVIGLHDIVNPTTGLTRVDLKRASTDEIGGITEPPLSPIGVTYTRSNEGEWVQVPEAGKPLEFRIGIDEVNGVVDLQPPKPGPNLEIGGVYGTPRSERNGIEIDSYGHISAPLATDELAGTIVEPPADAKGYVRTTQLNGESQWVPPAPSETLIAGNAPKDLGSVYVPARNKTSQGLDLNADGGLYAPPATHEHLGTLLEPPPDDKQYARQQTALGTKIWTEIIPNSGGINDVPRDPVGEEYVRAYNRWLPVQKGGQVQPRKVNVGGDTMTGLLILSGNATDPLGAVAYQQLDALKVYVDAQDTVTQVWTAANFTVQPPPGGPYWMLDGGWSNIPAGIQVTYGIGIDLNGDVVNLQPPKPGPNLEIGGVYGTPRSERNGIEIDSNGHISTPLATDLLAGSLLEPPPDDKKYSRVRTAAGVSSWVEGADVEIATNTVLGVVKVPARGLMTGLDIDTQGNLTAPKATHQHLGTIVEPPETGKQYARFRDPVTGINAWQEIMAGGVIISDTPPANPQHGMLWWESDTGDLFVFYVDPGGAPGQWVEAVAGAEPGTKMHVSDTMPNPGAAKAGDLWFSSDTGALAVFYQDDDGTQWVQIGGSSSAGTPFPEAPIDGTPYSRQDAAWVAAVSAAIVADVAPVSTVPGAMWFDSTNATLSVNYIDANTTQWITVGGGGGGGSSGGITQADADLRYLQLTGGTVTGALNVNNNFKLSIGTAWFGHPSGMAMMFFCGADMTSPLYQINWDANQMNIGRPGADHMRLKGGSVVEFAAQPTVNGTPIVMMAEHNAALERIGVLEALLTKLQARLDICCPE